MWNSYFDFLHDLVFFLIIRLWKLVDFDLVLQNFSHNLEKHKNVTQTPCDSVGPAHNLQRIAKNDCLGLRNILCLFICACAQIFLSDLSCLGGNAALLLLVPAEIILWQMVKCSRHTWCRRLELLSSLLAFLIRSLNRHDLEADWPVSWTVGTLRGSGYLLWQLAGWCWPSHATVS